MVIYLHELLVCMPCHQQDGCFSEPLSHHMIRNTQLARLFDTDSVVKKGDPHLPGLTGVQLIPEIYGQ